MNDPQLMKLFDFNESELNENRNGRLSDRQAKRLQKVERSQKGCSSILGGLLIIVALVGVVIAVSVVPAVISDDRGAAIGIGIAFGVIWPLIWGAFGFFTIRRAFARMEVKVKTAEGPINIVKVVRQEYNPSTKLHNEREAYELRIDGLTFEVQADLADVMMQGDVYAVYHAEFNISDKEGEILSAEFLKKDK